MQHYKILIFSIVILFFQTTFGQSPNSNLSNSVDSAVQTNKVSDPKAKKLLSFWTLGTGLSGWKEIATLTRQNTKESTFGDFLGTDFSVQFEKYSDANPHQGYLLEGQILVGKATVGGSQPSLTFISSQQPWSAVMTSARYIYRWTTSVSFSAGPMLIYRTLKLESDPSGTEAVSGANLNYGPLADVTMMLSPHWEIKQSFGSLLSQGAFYWSINIGYQL